MIIPYLSNTVKTLKAWAQFTLIGSLSKVCMDPRMCEIHANSEKFDKIGAEDRCRWPSLNTRVIATPQCYGRLWGKLLWVKIIEKKDFHSRQKIMVFQTFRASLLLINTTFTYNLRCHFLTFSYNPCEIFFIPGSHKRKLLYLRYFVMVLFVHGLIQDVILICKSLIENDVYFMKGNWLLNNIFLQIKNTVPRLQILTSWKVQCVWLSQLH